MKKVREIILIDDDGPTNFLHQVVIKRSKCAEIITVFDNAGEALKYLLGMKKNGKKNLLILLDVNMPVMSGWDFINQFSKRDHPESILVMLTSSINPNDEVRAKKIKAINAYRSKPLSEEVLNDIITEFF